MTKKYPSRVPDRLDDLVSLSHRLGEPTADMAILAEGNTSCKDGTNFWVKASGKCLRDIDRDGFVQCDPLVLTECFGRGLSDAEVKEALYSSVKSDSNLRPSVEAFMHAWLLQLPGVEFVGHTHPTAVLSLVCSPGAQLLCRMRFFPDEVVCCGTTTVWIPYVDPGLPLAEKIATYVSAYLKEYNEVPKLLWLQNHGAIALGSTAHEVESALAMTTKAARMILMAGGLKAVEKESIVPLSAAVVDRIRTRPDEHYRQALLWQSGGTD